MRKTCALCLLLVGLLLQPLSVRAVSDSDLLLSAYLRYQLSEKVAEHSQGLIQNAPEPVAKEVDRAVKVWAGEQNTAIREMLWARFQDDAKTRFTDFVAQYTTAENGGDLAYLNQICGDLRMGTPCPSDYAGLRRLIMESDLQQNVLESSRLLGDVQTWLDLKGRGESVPPLQAWLARDQKEPAAAPKKPVVKKPANPLADAEVPAGEFNPEEGETASPLQSFDQMRQERRARALEESQAGMQQVAAERDAAEQEYAQKKAAFAAAEAENIKRHAEKLAANEQQALEQRQNSWAAKIKGVIGSTISAGSGAFFGGVGQRAGEEAAKELFGDK